MIEVRIGVAEAPRELVIEIDDDFDVVQKSIDSSLSGDGPLWLTDRKGKRIVVPAGRVAYVEISPEPGPRAVGFGSR